MKWYLIVVWKREDGTYYYRKVKGGYSDYYEGYVNNYGHKVILCIDVSELHEFDNPSIKKRIANKIISWLNKVK